MYTFLYPKTSKNLCELMTGMYLSFFKYILWVGVKYAWSITLEVTFERLTFVKLKRK